MLVTVLHFFLAYLVASLVHELGHLVAARWFGVRVLRAFLFADVGGRVLIRRRHKHLVYGIGWWPLLSYVKLLGVEQVHHALLGHSATAPYHPGDIRCRPRWQRASIYAAGVVMNLAAALTIVLLPEETINPRWWLLLFGTQVMVAFWNVMPWRGHDGWFFWHDRVPTMVLNDATVKR